MQILAIIIALIFLPLLLTSLWSARHEDKVLRIPGNLPTGVKRMFLLDTPEQLKAICPSEFLTKHNRDRWKILAGFACAALSVLLAVIVFKKLQIKLQIAGLPLPDVLWILGLSGAGIHIGWAAFKRSKTYAIELDLGDDPLVTPELRRSQKLMACALAVMAIGQLALFPQRVLSDLHWFLSTITMIEFATQFYAVGTQLTLTEVGVQFSRWYRTPWDKIVWYRWYENRAGVLLGLDQISIPVPIRLLPVTPENERDVADILQRFLPDKELDVIDTTSASLKVVEPAKTSS